MTGGDGGRAEGVGGKVTDRKGVGAIKGENKEGRHRLGCNYYVRHPLSAVYFDSSANSREGYL